jgi:hypothetical protein
MLVASTRLRRRMFFGVDFDELIVVDALDRLLEVHE